jgi:hypothetical protein
MTPLEAEENKINAINTKSKYKWKKNKLKDTVKENKDNYYPLSLENIKRNQEKDKMCLALIILWMMMFYQINSNLLKNVSFCLVIFITGIGITYRKSFITIRSPVQIQPSSIYFPHPSTNEEYSP